MKVRPKWRISPLQHEGWIEIKDSNNEVVVDILGSEEKAELIVMAVNEYDELKKKARMYDFLVQQDSIGGD